MEAQAVLEDRFQAMAVPEAMRGWAAPVVPVAMEPQGPMDSMPLAYLLLQPATMAVLAEMARPAAMGGLVEWEARHWGRAPLEQMETMAMEAMGAQQAVAVLEDLAAMARAEVLFHLSIVWARAEGLAAQRDSQALAVWLGEPGPQLARLELLATAAMAAKVATAEA